MTAPLRSSFAALGTTATVLVAASDPARLLAAHQVLAAELERLDAACSRFRPDSELTLANDAAGERIVVGALLAEAIGAALRAARLTDGAVDPTIGGQLCALGYDRTFDEVPPRDLAPAPWPVPARGWRDVEFRAESRALRVPVGTRLDLGATAKALGADRAAALCASAAGCGVLVNLGGDIALGGEPPSGGWVVAVGDDHRDPGPAAASIALSCGALATSSTKLRSWRRGSRAVHHIIDPATGHNPLPVWRTVSVAAATCVDANAAATAAIVKGRAAPDWLSSLDLPARLVSASGAVTCVAGWPAGAEAAADSA